MEELRAARDQVAQSYDNPPLSLEKEEQPRVRREEFMRFLNGLYFGERTKHGVIVIERDHLEHIKDIILQLPQSYHNRIDYKPLINALDKWIIRYNNSEDGYVFACYMILGIILITFPILALFWIIFQGNTTNSNSGATKHDELRRIRRALEEKDR